MYDVCSLEEDEVLPVKLQIPQMCVEIKDAKRKYNFEPFEPPSPAFKASILFAQGLRSGLAFCKIHKQVRVVEPFYIFSQLPKGGAEFTSETAGLIYGLGLAGHLKGFKAMDIFELLSQKHEETSAALLLGLAISNQGSCDESLSQLIGIHTKAFNSSSTNEAILPDLPLRVQYCAILGLGFLYQGANDRRLSMLLFRELWRRDPISNKLKAASPAYTASAGLALGLINLGSGRDAESLEGSGLGSEQVEALLSAFEGTDQNDPDHAIPAACFALIGIFGGSRDHYIGSRMGVPSLGDLQSGRKDPKPVHLFMRLIARTLVTGKFPYEHDEIWKLKEMDTHSLFIKGYLHYIEAAFNVSMAIINAGSWRKQPGVFPSERPDVSLDSPTDLYQKHYSDSHQNFAGDMFNLYMSLIMSGSGNPPVFILLRQQFMNPLGYTSTLAYFNHLALGCLVVGKGRGKLSTKRGTDPLAMLGIVASIFAGFNDPLLEDDYFFPHHMQAFWRFSLVPNYREGLHESLLERPEDLFLGDDLKENEDPCVQEAAALEYLIRTTGWSKLFEELGKEQLELLEIFHEEFLPIHFPKKLNLRELCLVKELLSKFQSRA